MIKTKRLELIPLELRHAEELMKIWGDYDVIKYTNNDLLKSKEECVRKLTTWINNGKDNAGPCKFAVLLHNKLIGLAGFPVIDNENFKCGFFYQIAKEYWGQGYGYETAKALSDFMTSQHKKGIFLAGVVKGNVASEKILRKLGYKEISVDKNGFNKNGIIGDVINFQL
ncbi:MAG: GNAT family N-acetyltransferase [Clostridiaceae bacterium]|nr:GNAT family N-acetyltransferase [Clostridiaceae bacterium]